MVRRTSIFLFPPVPPATRHSGIRRSHSGLLKRGDTLQTGALAAPASRTPAAITRCLSPGEIQEAIKCCDVIGKQEHESIKKTENSTIGIDFIEW